ncbi:hypothetical protein HFK83_23310 [Ralstonia pseudosolanacearum]|uniref:hypothetical protein n=1 Tax=Ralstonia pseudosolanacearum TaxID=1310165 RepID=UPI0020039FC1|nr:hypothetical protein [Ralstonia pseudosolanacearum]MCK4125286.1 hypothetical protein [Ralstonia pseudosolanacearum]
MEKNNGSVAIQAYEACEIGGNGSMQPTENSHNALEVFQRDVVLAEQLEKKGKIRIRTRHTESKTGHHFVDLILFERLA